MASRLLMTDDGPTGSMIIAILDMTLPKAHEAETIRTLRAFWDSTIALPGCIGGGVFQELGPDASTIMISSPSHPATCDRPRHPLRTGMIPPQLPGSPSYLRPGTPALAKFLLDLGYNTGEFGKNHLGDHTASLPTAHGFQEYWGYLYHLDAVQQVSFPDINSTPTVQGVAPPCKNTPVPGLPEVPGAVDQKTTLCLMPPRPVIWCNSSDGTEKNQTCKDEGPLTLERSKTVDESVGDGLPGAVRLVGLHRITRLRG
jgi:hypothetical protein